MRTKQSLENQEWCEEMLLRNTQGAHPMVRRFTNANVRTRDTQATYSFTAHTLQSFDFVLMLLVFMREGELNQMSLFL